MYKPKDHVVPDFDADGIGALPRRHRGPAAAAPHQSPGAASPPGSSQGYGRYRRWRPPRDVPTSWRTGESPPRNTNELLFSYIDSTVRSSLPARGHLPNRGSAGREWPEGRSVTNF